ncbi:hypothetical protein LJC60_00990 [Ruminococcaceae bacterium OttesenSCG-928-D13]|nr:hypothetical protein [Ruminococcaceae bacterium OttesenSCG-928-D13]
MHSDNNLAVALGEMQKAVEMVPGKGQEFTSAGKAAIDEAHALEITGESDLRVAAGLMDGFKKAKKSVADFFKPMKDSAHRAHKEICAREKILLTPFDDADRAVKNKVTTYTAEQRRLAEIEAARIRAAQEAEAKRLVEQACEAEEGGDAASAEMLLKQAEITETIKVPVTTAPKVDGISYRTTYSVEITDLSAVPCEIGGVVIRPVDESAVRRMAQMAKGQLNIPGIKIITTKEAYSR